MRYKRAANGTKVKGKGDPITKESVFKMTQERLNKEFPNNKIPEQDVRDISMVWLLSGLRPDIMDQQIQKLKDKSAPRVKPPKPKRTTAGGEVDSDDALMVDGKKP